MTFRNAAPETVHAGIDAAIKYVQALGFEYGSLLLYELTASKRIIEKTIMTWGAGPVTEAKAPQVEAISKTIQRSMERVKWFIHELAMQQEPEFDKRRVFPRFIYL